MGDIVEIRAVVRRTMADRVIAALKEAGVPRMTVMPVHSIGAGVDPAAAKVSWREGSEYSDKVLVQFICGGVDCASMHDIIAGAAHTGRQGDGIVAVYPVLQVRKIRTGALGLDALA